jgi:cobalt-zinc-cadmium efflux system outer membrane protein
MRRATLLLVAAAMSGCAVPKNAGFSHVRASVAERIDRQVEWTRDSDEDEAVAASVRRLLEQELTVDGAIQIALLNNQQLQAVYEDLGVAQAALVQAGLLKNPVFDAAVRLRIDGGPVNPEFAIAQNFLDILYIPMRKRVASAEFEAAKRRGPGGAPTRRRGAHRHELQADAVAQLERAPPRRKCGRRRCNAHAAPATSATRARQRRGTRRAEPPDVAATEEHVRPARAAQLAHGLVGSGRHAARLPNVPDDERDLAGLERSAVASSLDLAEVRELVAAAHERVVMTRASGLLPSLDVGAHADRDDGEWEVGPSIGFPVPIFDQGQAAVATSRSEQRRAERRFHALSVQLRAAVRAARNRMIAARQRAVYYRRVLMPLRQRIVAQTQLEYNAMLLGVFQLLQATTGDRQRQADATRCATIGSAARSSRRFSTAGCRIWRPASACRSRLPTSPSSRAKH